MSSGRIEKLRNMLEGDPNDTFCLYALAQECAKAGDHQEAVTWYDRTLTVDPDYLYAYFHKARSLDELGRVDEARGVLNEGLTRARQVGDVKAADEMEEYLGMLPA